MNKWIIASSLLILTACASTTDTSLSSAKIRSFSISSARKALIAGDVNSIAKMVATVLDEQDRKVMEHTSPRTVDRMDRGEPLTVNDIIKLSQGGVTDESIIRYLQETQANYNLSQAQLRRMHDAGVSQRVIDFMVNTPR